MYSDIPFWLSIVFMVGGLVALAWSSDAFVDGAAKVAKALGIAPLIVGMVIIGFGTSAPELCVSAMAGMSGHANLSLGNAYGSCTFNIAVILGVATLIRPLAVRPSTALIGGLGLTAITLFSFWVLSDGTCSRTEAGTLLTTFFVILPLYCWFDQKRKSAHAKTAAAEEEVVKGRAFALALLRLFVGLGVLIGSSHVLVWGAVDFAKFIGVSDLVIGLTIIAVGTSLPELASAIQSARRGEHEFVLGNIIGSNIFNSLAVVGLATFLSPLEGTEGARAFSPYILTRDLPVMTLLSLSVLAFGANWHNLRKAGRVRRWSAFVWLSVFVVYTLVMFYQETH